MEQNKLLIVSALFVLVFLILPSVQAKDEPLELKGEEAKIIDILKNGTALQGKMVVIEGKIDTECPSGCWFIVNDETEAFTLIFFPTTSSYPRKRGEDAKVYGEVVIKDGDPMIIGKMVEIGGEIYQ